MHQVMSDIITSYTKSLPFFYYITTCLQQRLLEFKSTLETQSSQYAVMPLLKFSCNWIGGIRRQQTSAEAVYNLLSTVDVIYGVGYKILTIATN